MGEKKEIKKKYYICNNTIKIVFKMWNGTITWCMETQF